VRWRESHRATFRRQPAYPDEKSTNDRSSAPNPPKNDFTYTTPESFLVANSRASNCEIYGDWHTLSIDVPRGNPQIR